MSPVDQLEYFQLRAQVERDLADAAGDTIAGQIHRELAHRYEAAIERTQHRPTLSIVTNCVSPSVRFPPIPEHSRLNVCFRPIADISCLCELSAIMHPSPLDDIGETSLKSRLRLGGRGSPR